MSFEDAISTLEGVEETLRRFAMVSGLPSGEAFAANNQANLIQAALETLRQQ